MQHTFPLKVIDLSIRSCLLSKVSRIDGKIYLEIINL